VIRNDDWTAVTPHEFERLKTELGGAQPFARLQWLAALVAGEGRLAPGYDPNLKYKLLKWPQIEREFPKHFRIATAMMKGPQLLTEIAEGSSVPLTEVTDFVNAGRARGSGLDRDARRPARSTARQVAQPRSTHAVRGAATCHRGGPRGRLQPGRLGP
jgi:hypothetical protein